MTSTSPSRITPKQMEQIARTRNLGVSPKEIAAEYGITVFSVMALTRRYNEQRDQARRISKAFRRQIVKAPPVTMPEPTIPGDHYTVHRNGMAITLPLLSIQRSN